jgi:NADH-quinone oxidoreductase subunit G
MPRPEINFVTFSIDGREVSAPEGSMLVDGAKYGDVEIPVFCYEPKLGQPVGACRMCLVEIEGIPKLQTACSTPVKDGMVVHTQTGRVHDAQRAVVEFLLINHPLDCPVCDKGGECPLQDITYGWGPGTSRFIEPKRHFKKPLELSPLVAIDRERCILCYRCVRFSQEVAEDYQLVLLERGAHSFVGTFDGHPYVAPFSGNIIELCPVGALTSRAYRFRARPWDIESGGTICTMCPAQCNVNLTVRDERVQRALARDHDEVDDGWLCDKGRFAYQHVHSDQRIVTPLVREGTELMPASWEKALAAASGALKKAGLKTAALAGGETSSEEAFLLQSLLRDGLGSGQLAARPGGELPAATARALADPALQATVPDLEFAHAVLLLGCDPVDDAPVWDLRLRKGIRRRGVKLAVAGARPTALDPSATAILRHAPGAAEALLVAMDAVLSGDEGNLGGAATAAGTNAQSVRDLVTFLQEAGTDLVIVYGEGAVSAQGAEALLNLTARLGLRGRAGAGLLEIPSSTNGRGLREAGFAPGHGPGYVPLAEGVRAPADAAAIAEALAAGELTTLWLQYADPVRSFPDRALWERALHAANTVIAVESVMTDTVREHADVVFPGEAYAEKEGTLVHPDGRLQRLRPVIARPRPHTLRTTGSAQGVRPIWQVITEVARAAGLDARVLSGGMASQQLFANVPFYAGLTLDAIGGRGIRWPETEAGLAWTAGEWSPARLTVPATAPAVGGDRDHRLRLGTFRTLWASKEVDHSAALAFLRARQVVELSPEDAATLGIRDGDRVEVGSDGARVQGAVRLRAAIPSGSVFLAAGTHDQPANALASGLVEVRRVGGTATNGARVGGDSLPAQVTPAAEGLAEAPASAPMDIPPTTGGLETTGGGSEG